MEIVKHETEVAIMLFQEFWSRKSSDQQQLMRLIRYPQCYIDSGSPESSGEYTVERLAEGRNCEQLVDVINRCRGLYPSTGRPSEEEGGPAGGSEDYLGGEEEGRPSQEPADRDRDLDIEMSVDVIRAEETGDQQQQQGHDHDQQQPAEQTTTTPTKTKRMITHLKRLSTPIPRTPSPPELPSTHGTPLLSPADFSPLSTATKKARNHRRPATAARPVNSASVSYSYSSHKLPLARGGTPKAFPIYSSPSPPEEIQKRTPRTVPSRASGRRRPLERTPSPSSSPPAPSPPEVVEIRRMPLPFVAARNEAREPTLPRSSRDTTTPSSRGPPPHQLLPSTPPSRTAPSRDIPPISSRMSHSRSHGRSHSHSRTQTSRTQARTHHHQPSTPPGPSYSPVIIPSTPPSRQRAPAAAAPPSTPRAPGAPDTPLWHHYPPSDPSDRLIPSEEPDPHYADSEWEEASAREQRARDDQLIPRTPSPVYVGFLAGQVSKWNFGTPSQE